LDRLQSSRADPDIEKCDCLNQIENGGSGRINLNQLRGPQECGSARSDAGLNQKNYGQAQILKCSNLKMIDKASIHIFERKGDLEKIAETATVVLKIFQKLTPTEVNKVLITTESQSLTGISHKSRHRIKILQLLTKRILKNTNFITDNALIYIKVKEH
uniref:Uncharacterized protein n=1 Tax=Romanomermis culicivorax TaxID=13658 RepID=A0A915JHI6_ROMCU